MGQRGLDIRSQLIFLVPSHSSFQAQCTCHLFKEFLPLSMTVLCASSYVITQDPVFLNCIYNLFLFHFVCISHLTMLEVQTISSLLSIVHLELKTWPTFTRDIINICLMNEWMTPRTDSLALLAYPEYFFWVRLSLMYDKNVSFSWLNHLTGHLSENF